ncbi:hypothetical protein [Chamaesiphon sp. VAR_48_metabat_403]|uniref:hypothetical protein n=1 Tax=Chamaesiphon sp. VAR_48_metabat_403 TaxID=2964700 RepID=UPI00286D9C99|nr:hypothetical protein [Chamaesiphon sp. VAR_48_metabat_403]
MILSTKRSNVTIYELYRSIDRISFPKPDRIKYHHESRSIEHYYPHNQIMIDIGWWGWAGSFTISGTWR